MGGRARRGDRGGTGVSDWWTTSIKLQADLLEAQRRTLHAAAHGVAMQEIARRTAQANLAAMQGWAKLWGVK